MLEIAAVSVLSIKQQHLDIENERRTIMTKTNWKLWFKAAAVRAVKTVAQTAVATIGTTAALSQVDWVLVASSAALAGVLSLLTSIAGLPEVKAEIEE